MKSVSVARVRSRNATPVKNSRNSLYFAEVGVVLRISIRFQKTYDLSLPKQTFLPK